ncbi:MmgE/PrpD family protein [Sulfuracidifex tepidarius]|nr:MmgE/PrpD family protein [Sulfuracidifex tepidarius]
MIVGHYSSYSLAGEDELKMRLLDALAVAYAARRERIPFSLTLIQGDVPSLMGMTSVDSAAFVNTFLIRYLDFNDTFLGLEPLHPSDMIGGLLALGYVQDSSGEDLLHAMGLGYDVGVSLCKTTSLRKKGFDHVNFLGIGAAVASGYLLSLSEEQLRNAVSLTVVPHVALRETRSGKLTSWKAGAAAEAVRNAVFSSLLAKSGMEGPPLPFQGKYGFTSLVARDMDLSRFKPNVEVRNTAIKEFPVEYHAQAAVEASLKAEWSGKIESVLVETYEAAVSILADEDKWNPENRETADHSLPFTVSYSLLRRDFWLDSYSHIHDRDVRDLMKLVQVREVKEFSQEYPEKLPVRLTVNSSSVEVDVPKGYPTNPMTMEEVEAKARRLGLPEKVISLVRELEEVKVKDLVREIT